MGLGRKSLARRRTVRALLAALAPLLALVYLARREAVGELELVLAVAATMVLLGRLVHRSVARTTESLDAVMQATEAICADQFEARVASDSRRSEEYRRLERAFNRMADHLQASQQRIRVLNRAMSEIFDCKDGDGLLKKAVEIACTQCGADLASFLPRTPGHAAAFADATVFVGLHGWLWRNHRLTAVTAETWEREVEIGASGKLYAFNLKFQGKDLGQLRVAYGEMPSEELVSLLHEVVSLVERSIVRLEQVRLGAMVSTELEVADAVRRAVAEDAVPASMRQRVAFHYEPSSRLGGDWFNLFEDARRQKLYVIIGDVTGHGLVQGMVTTAVKGALDAISRIVAVDEESEAFSPARIMTLLETVVRRVAGASELAMSCLAVEIDFARGEMRACNAGHTFPLLVRQAGDANEVTQLHRSQQPSLGQMGTEAHVYVDAVYPLAPRDLLVIYSDGLSQAKALKSPIFGRLLFRSLRARRPDQSPDAMKEDILAMFRYYTQGRRIEDDVCFLVLQVDDVRQQATA